MGTIRGCARASSRPPASRGLLAHTFCGPLTRALSHTGDSDSDSESQYELGHTSDDDDDDDDAAQAPVYGPEPERVPAREEAAKPAAAEEAAEPQFAGERLFVALEHAVSAQKLRARFAAFGDVRDVRVTERVASDDAAIEGDDAAEGGGGPLRAIHHGFVTFAAAADATLAIEELDAHLSLIHI